MVFATMQTALAGNFSLASPRFDVNKAQMHFVAKLLEARGLKVKK